jgi:methylated-DNA-[protein]-cysteine S-methyltransferase
MVPFSYSLLPTTFGAVGLVWQDAGQGPRVHHIFLPRETVPTERAIETRFAGARPLSCREIEALGEDIRRTLAGEAVDLTLEMLALGTCQPFQQSVLVAEHQIPRGWVSTYGRIAAHLGARGAARAVGNALARNPFPIVIPCHRAIQSDGSLGGFQGGVRMKRALLELEGVEFSPAGKVASGRVYY